MLMISFCVVMLCVLYFNALANNEGNTCAVKGMDDYEVTCVLIVKSKTTKDEEIYGINAISQNL